MCSSSALVREVRAGDGHGGEHLVEDAVGAHLLGERLVGEDEPVSQRILHQRAQVLREDVVAAADERERTRRLHEADRPARAGAVRDVRGQAGST